MEWLRGEKPTQSLQKEEAKLLHLDNVKAKVEAEK